MAGVKGRSGGARAGSGRPRSDPPVRAVSAYLTEEQVKFLRSLGKGEVSAGLRWLVDAAKGLLVRESEQ